MSLNDTKNYKKENYISQASVEEISGNHAKKIKMKIIKIGRDLLDFGLPSRSNVAYM